MTDDPTHRRPPHPRTRIADVLLADAPTHLDADADAVEAVLDCAFSATEAACLSSHELLDWEEHRNVEVA